MKGLLLVDVDGTLVDAGGAPWPEATLLATRALELDWRICLCSGRPVLSLMRLAEGLGPAVRFISALQGALTYCREETTSVCRTGWVPLSRFALDRGVPEMIERLICPSDPFWLFTETNWYVREVEEVARAEARATGVPWASNGLWNQSHELLKAVVVCPQHQGPHLKLLSQSKLPTRQFASQPGYIEIVSERVGDDKGARVLIAASKLQNASPARTVALGDGLNDLGMLAAADIALTFADAPPALVRAADIVLDKDRGLALKSATDLLSVS